MANPQVIITMESGGEMVVELNAEKAPNTVNNFLALAQSGYYNGLIFHRVIPGFMIQGGCPNGSGTGNPGYRIQGEYAKNGFTQNDLKHTRGVISMARQGDPFYDSAGSQFFIMVADAPFLDGDYAAFGKVLSGMEVADAIVAADRDMRDKPYENQRIASVRVELFDENYDPPRTLPL